MIIRVVSTISLILLLILVLYLPSAYPPEHFISQLDIEHERNRAFWGEEHALRILSRMLELHTDAKQASPIPVTLASSEPRNQVDSAAASQMSARSKKSRLKCCRASTFSRWDWRTITLDRTVFFSTASIIT